MTQVWLSGLEPTAWELSEHGRLSVSMQQFRGQDRAAGSDQEKVSITSNVRQDNLNLLG